MKEKQPMKKPEKPIALVPAEQPRNVRRPKASLTELATAVERGRQLRRETEQALKDAQRDHDVACTALTAAEDALRAEVA